MYYETFVTVGCVTGAILILVGVGFAIAEKKGYVIAFGGFAVLLMLPEDEILSYYQDIVDDVREEDGEWRYMEYANLTEEKVKALGYQRLYQR